MRKKTQSPGSHLSDEESTHEVQLRDKMLPGMSKRTRARHSRTVEIHRAPPLKKRAA